MTTANLYESGSQPATSANGVTYAVYDAALAINAASIVRGGHVFHLDAAAPVYVGERRGVHCWGIGATRESLNGVERSRRMQMVLGAAIVAKIQAARGAVAS